MSKYAIVFEHVDFKYKYKEVLKDVSFHIEKGDFVGIIGPNGSGKTTILNLILGLLTPTAGKIEILGHSVKESRRYVSYLPQLSPLDPRFPILVYEVVLMGRYRDLGFFKNPKKEDFKLVDEALEAVGMKSFKHTPFGHLSGGERQRVLIARALVQHPKIVLLDEPTSALDVKSKNDVANLIWDVHKEFGLTTLFITHDLNIVSDFATKVLYINKKVYGFGKPEEILTKEMLESIYGTQVILFNHGGKTCVIVGDEHGRSMEF